MNRWLTSRLASQAGTRAAELIVHADAAGAVAAAVVDRAFRQIFDRSNHQSPRFILSHLPAEIWQAQRDKLGKLIAWSHYRAATALVDTMPKAYLRAAVNSRLSESKRNKLREHGPIFFGFGNPLQPQQFTTQDLTLSSEDEAARWMEFLFPPPSQEQTRTILDRLLGPEPPATLSYGAAPVAPSTIADTMARLWSEGKPTDEVARAVRPYFDGSAMAATRAARTMGAYIGSERNLATSEALGDMVMGYQVHSAGGENARHAHAMRSGTVYYRNPKPEQFGMDVMPHPPVDTGRGPYDAGKGIQWNCRCWITPVLAPLPVMQTPAFEDNAGELIPDVSHFSDWFNSATIQQQRAAAGVRRLATAADLLGRAPTWADLVHPKTGRLLSVDALRSESESQRIARRAQAQVAIATNRALTKRVAAFGTV